MEAQILFRKLLYKVPNPDITKKTHNCTIRNDSIIKINTDNSQIAMGNGLLTSENPPFQLEKVELDLDCDKLIME